MSKFQLFRVVAVVTVLMAFLVAGINVKPASAAAPMIPFHAQVAGTVTMTGAATFELSGAGVASGLARYFNSDPLFVRLGFVLLAFLQGFGQQMTERFAVSNRVVGNQPAGQRHVGKSLYRNDFAAAGQLHYFKRAAANVQAESWFGL